MNMKAASLLVALAAASLSFSAAADQFTEEDLQTWEDEYMAAVTRGRELFTDATLGGSKNGVVCAQCHPNGANTHPETYPKFQQQLGRVIAFWEMINWCIQNPLEGEPLDAGDPDLIALEAYITHERRGVGLDPGKH